MIVSHVLGEDHREKEEEQEETDFDSTATAVAAATTTATSLGSPPLVLPIRTCSSVCQRSCVEPETGRILLERSTTSYREQDLLAGTTATWNEQDRAPVGGSDDRNASTAAAAVITTCCSSLWQDIDSCIDNTLQCLRRGDVPWRSADAADDDDEQQQQQQQQQFDSSHSSPPHSFEIVAVGITCFVMNLVGIRSSSSIKEEQPILVDMPHIITDGKYTCSYACNTTRVQQECLKLHQLLGQDRVGKLYQRTGAPIHPAYALGQLRALYHDVMEEESEEPKQQMMMMRDIKVDKKISKWTSIASICISNWTERDIHSMPISYSEASWTGMFDFWLGKWDEECLSLLPISCRNALPQVGQEVVEGGLNGEYQQRWPEFRKDCKFLLGCGDGACANIGSKCTSGVNRIAVTIGTSAAARLLLRLPVRDEGSVGGDASLDEIPMGLFCYRVDKDHVLLGGALTDGGSVIAWLRELLNLKSQDEYHDCEQKALVEYRRACTASHEKKTNTVHSSSSSSSNKVLTFLPFLSGERSTGFRVGATGCISGLSRCTTSVDLLRECLESVVLRINAILELFQKALIRLDHASDAVIVASGNALEKSDLWRKMLADCSGMTVVLDEDAHEGTSRGAALLVAKMLVEEMSCCKTTTSIEMSKEKLSVSHQSTPDELCRRYWMVKKQIQNQLIDTMESSWK